MQDADVEARVTKKGGGAQGDNKSTVRNSQRVMWIFTLNSCCGEKPRGGAQHQKQRGSAAGSFRDLLSNATQHTHTHLRKVHRVTLTGGKGTLVYISPCLVLL